MIQSWVSGYKQLMCSNNEMHAQHKGSQPSQRALTTECVRNMRRVGQADQLQMCIVERPCYQESDRSLYLQSAQFSLLGCQEAALTRRIAWRRGRGGVGLGPSGKQLYPATPELTAWRERPADSSQ